MTPTVYPTFNICNLNTDKLLQDLISIEPFGGYVSRNPHLRGIHSHSFYHLAYFRKADARHTIDFCDYTVQQGTFYLMKPGQVHHWDFDAHHTEGVVINFVPLFFDALQCSSHILESLPLFQAEHHHRILNLNPELQLQTEVLLDRIIAEKLLADGQSRLYIANCLLQLFILIGRQLSSIPQQEQSVTQYDLFRRFEQDVDLHFRQDKLPKAYAARLFVSTHQLNAVCNKVAGISAGTLIRNRILLEAKRLLVNFKMNISEIAYELDFSDNSNFAKFFKKYTGMSPEQFRSHYKQG